MSLYGNTTRQVVRQQFAPISVSASGDNVVVAGVANARIRVVHYNLMAAGAVVCTWKSSVAGAITGPKSCAANGGIEVPYVPVGAFQTAIGEDLVLNLGGNVSVGGELTYILV